MKLGVVLMRFVAFFCFFDALNLVFSGAIKGAGDTRFIMWTIAALSLGVMIIPIYVIVEILHAGIYVAWTLLMFYIWSLGLAFMLRYRQGKWKKMRVIEDSPALAKARRTVVAVTVADR
jgi:MATE family multidrug resistance protein